MASERSTQLLDKTYGWKPYFGKNSDRFKKVIGNFSRQALRLQAIFIEPNSGKTCEFQCEPPQDFKELLQELKIDNLDNDDN